MSVVAMSDIGLPSSQSYCRSEAADGCVARGMVSLNLQSYLTFFNSPRI